MSDDEINEIVGKYLTVDILKYSMFKKDSLKYDVNDNILFIKYISPYIEYLNILSKSIPLPVFVIEYHINKENYVDKIYKHLTEYFIRHKSEGKDNFIKKVKRNYILKTL